MDPSVAYFLLKTLSQDRPAIISASHRLIAYIARQRAQTKKLRTRSPSGSRVTEDASRDIQAYTSLLASMRFEKERSYSIGGLPLRIREEDMFSINEQRFNSARAIRFAAYSLLREDLDHDFQLSIVFDEDALRLDLYQLLLLETGRQHPSKLARPEMPRALPQYLMNGIFSDTEVPDLLNTVAVAAYHAQRFDDLAGIIALAGDYVASCGSAELDIQMTRLWYSQIDAHILQGGPPEGDGHRATLRNLDTVRDRLFRGIGANINTLVTSGRPVTHFKAYMRLLAREAEL